MAHCTTLPFIFIYTLHHSASQSMDDGHHKGERKWWDRRSLEKCDAETMVLQLLCKTCVCACVMQGDSCRSSRKCRRGLINLAISSMTYLRRNTETASLLSESKTSSFPVRIRYSWCCAFWNLRLLSVIVLTSFLNTANLAYARHVFGWSPHHHPSSFDHIP